MPMTSTLRTIIPTLIPLLAGYGLSTKARTSNPPKIGEGETVGIPDAERESAFAFSQCAFQIRPAYRCRAGLGKVTYSLRQPAKAASLAKNLRRTPLADG